MKARSFLSASAVLLFATVARANDPAAAEALFRDGRALLAQGNVAEACAKLEESQRLDPAIGTLYHVADCHEHLGKIATAWAELIDVAAEAKQHGQRDREAAARKRADTLAPRLPHVVLEGTPPRDAEVRRDATVVGPAEIGASIPVDPGTHKITVRAPGHVPWELTVVASESGTVRVKLPPSLQASPGAAVPAAAAPIPASTAFAPTQPTEQPAADAGHGHVQRDVGIAIAGAGLVSLGVGTYSGIRSIDKRNEARGHCNGSVCDADGVSLRGDAISAGNVSTVTFIAGAAALVGGGVLFFTSPSSQERRSDSARASEPPRRGRLLSAAPYAGPTGAGLSLSGEFQ